jgi:uncharacterized protein YndB with AHSA1/START domain
MKRIAAVLACLAALAAAAGEKMLVKEVVVKASVEEVFKAWTTSDGVASFFAPEAHIEPRPEGRFEVYMNPYARPGMKGADDMRVLAVQPGKLLSFTWNAPPHLAEARKQRTVVILRFAPADGGTAVTLTQVGWGEGGEWDQSYQYFDKAWANVLANLQRRFAEGPIDFTEWRKRMRAFQDSEDAKK